MAVLTVSTAVNIEKQLRRAAEEHRRSEAVQDSLNQRRKENTAVKVILKNGEECSKRAIECLMASPKRKKSDAPKNPRRREAAKGRETDVDIRSQGQIRVRTFVDIPP